MKQERVIRPRRKMTKDREAIEELVVEEPDAELLTDIDDLLDEIDSVLEDQALVGEFRQRSGQ